MTTELDELSIDEEQFALFRKLWARRGAKASAAKFSPEVRRARARKAALQRSLTSYQQGAAKGWQTRRRKQAESHDSAATESP